MALGLLIATFVLTAWSTGLIRRYALTTGLIDIPNDRSMHAKPTPRGGGLAVVLGLSVSVIALFAAGWLRPRFTTGLLAGGAAIAWAGWLDDRRSLSPLVRLAIQIAAAAWAVAWPGEMEFVGTAAAFNTVITVLGLVWLTNLFNFMDGLDGFAASEAAFACCAAGSFLLFGHSAAASVTCWSLAAACLGFLTWNWPPARIFLGDTGSGYLGYVIGVFALESRAQHSLRIWIWLILLGAFIGDATVHIAAPGHSGRTMVQGPPDALLPARCRAVGPSRGHNCAVGN